MARNEIVRYAFNRGVISPLAVSRTDLKRAALSAETQENWMPRSLGSMMLRPGLGYIGASASNNPARLIDFVRSITNTHLMEFTNALLRIWTNDVLVTRVSVATAVTDGAFSTDASTNAAWTDNDEAGGVSAWSPVSAGVANLGLIGNGTAASIRDQQVTVAAGDINKEHALRIIIDRGPVIVRIGSTLGGDEYINQVTLYTGAHSLTFTPAGNFYIRFLSRVKRVVYVRSCNVEAAGVMTLPSPYLTADMNNIRANSESLSVDVQFVACTGYQQRRIERRDSGRSWSIILYQVDDGPFRADNVSTHTMRPSVIAGKIGRASCRERV